VASCDHRLMSALTISRLSDSILVGHLQTPLEAAVAFSPSVASADAQRELVEANYDQAPVVVDGVPVGFVLTDDLTGSDRPVGDHVKGMLPDALVSESSTLESALPWLESTGLLFLLSGRTISGFVVPSDLNRQAGRSYFYLGLTALELRLAEVVRRIGREQDLLALLPREASGAVRKRLAERKSADVEADVVAEMNLAHLFKILWTHGEVGSHLSIPDAESWEALWKPVNSLRARIAHPVQPVLESRHQLQALIGTDRTIHRLLSALR
jgi:hypothetical protein